MTVNDWVKTPATNVLEGVEVIDPAVVDISTVPVYEVTVLFEASCAVMVTENGVPAVCVDMAEIAK